MSSGDFGMELRQSVQASLETIDALAREAKARIGDGIAGLRPAAAKPQAFAEPVFEEPAYSPPPQPSPSKRYNVSFDDAYELPAQTAPVAFDDDPAFMSAKDGIPVWEDPP